ncbi:putative membrane protein [Hamadaea flava]|uniref:SRPBCC family protein n=1 Tax=Hamadaea flava TaxID=1742688 RepID=A0ABV8LMK5_9ACTN|nr:SRPBCC family protein [Hamadaea flava]MCP2323210.1 putative membrane protein [Hamadaea flava]
MTGDSQGGVLGKAVESLVSAAGKKAVSSIGDRMGSVTERLGDYAKNAAGGVTESVLENSGPAGKALGAVGKIKEKLGGGGSGGDKSKGKVTNIVESIDVGVPISVAYNQWTQFTDFPSFMKKVESVEQGDEPQKLSWKAQILWSHRSWESDIVEQVPDERIVWHSQGEKGYPDGAVTFHELGPNLTRIIVVLEYHPQGFFEYTGNLWRAQGRRVRLELKHFARHVMTDTILHPQDVTGWRGEIHDGEMTAEPGQAEADQDTEPDEGTEPDEDTEPEDTEADEGAEPDEEAEPEGRKRREAQENKSRRRPPAGRRTDERPSTRERSRDDRGGRTRTEA